MNRSLQEAAILPGEARYLLQHGKGKNKRTVGYSRYSYEVRYIGRLLQLGLLFNATIG